MLDARRESSVLVPCGLGPMSVLLLIVCQDTMSGDVECITTLYDMSNITRLE